jgi:hypothetical protein
MRSLGMLGALGHDCSSILVTMRDRQRTGSSVRPRWVTGRRLQLAGLSSSSRSSLLLMPGREQIVRPLDDYVRLVEALR